MASKAEMDREITFCKARIESLEDQLKASQADKETLLKQIDKLQDSLISVKAPDAYRDQQLEREGPPTPISQERIDKNKITQEFTTEYLNNMEKPLFRDGYDLDDLITTGLVRDHNPVPPSLHGNDES